MTTWQLEGKSALITGASGGIGAAVAEQLHAMGAKVTLAARSKDKLDEQCRKLGTRAFAVPMDVSSAESVRLAFERHDERYGSLDILINNAGFGLFETVADASPDAFYRMMEVNYHGVVRCTQAALPRMLASGFGTIVNVASIAGKFATAKSAGYSATKHAVLGFTNALRQELHGSGIHVMAVNPGPVRTAFFETADPDGSYVNSVKSMMVTPENVARELAKGIVRRKAEVHVPGWLGFAARMGQVLPAQAVTVIAARFLKLK